MRKPGTLFDRPVGEAARAAFPQNDERRVEETVASGRRAGGRHAWNGKGARILRMEKTLLEGVEVRRVSENVVSVMPAGEQGAPYDRRASLYDRLVPSVAYNRVLWGTRPADYVAFARQAVQAGVGPLLEVGCGTAAFTAELYRRAVRPCLLVDRSAAMLERAALRLRGSGSELPANVILLQADLHALPFAPGRFGSVLLMGGLHLFEDVVGAVARLGAQRAPDGRLHLSGLAAETAIGRRYLRLLHRAGEVGTPRSEPELRAEVERGLDGPVEDWRRRGSMVYAQA